MHEFTLTRALVTLEGEENIIFSDRFFLLRVAAASYTSLPPPSLFRFIHQRLIAKFPESGACVDPITSARDKRFEKKKLSVDMEINRAR